MSALAIRARMRRFDRRAADRGVYYRPGLAVLAVFLEWILAHSDPEFARGFEAGRDAREVTIRQAL